MKIQLDTDQKTIRIEESVNLGELVKTLENLLPNELWKEFKLDVTVLNNWINPIPWIIEPYRPVSPITQPWITYYRETPSINPYEVKFTSGTFNIIT